MCRRCHHYPWPSLTTSPAPTPRPGRTAAGGHRRPVPHIWGYGPSDDHERGPLAAEWAGDRPRGWPQIAAVLAKLRSEYTHDRDATARVPDFLTETRRGPDHLEGDLAPDRVGRVGHPDLAHAARPEFVGEVEPAGEGLVGRQQPLDADAQLLIVTAV